MMSCGIGFGMYPSFMSRVVNNAKRKGFLIESLGKVGTGDDVYIFSPSVIKPDRPNVLIAAGFHGDEAGGVYGISQFLEVNTLDFLNRVNLTILPAVNPSGLKLCRRNDYTDADPNRGYCHHECVPILGEIGEILMHHADVLSERARHGFLTLHEDSTIEDTFYLINNDNTLDSKRMLDALRQTGVRHFRCQPDGIHHEHYIAEGTGSWFCDSSFEDMLSHDGVSRLYVLETPALAPVELRTRAVSDIVTTFVSEIAAMPITHGTEVFSV